MSKIKNLLVDFGESAIKFIVLEEDEESSAIKEVYESVKTGCSPQVGNRASAYLINIQKIIENIQNLVSKYNVDTVVMNLPSIHDEIVVLQKNSKASYEDQIRKFNESFNTQDLVLCGPIMDRGQNYAVTAVSAIQKDYAELIDEVTDIVGKTYLTTSFIRLQLISKFLEVGKPHTIIDAGYSKLRGISFDENNVPIHTLSDSFCGRDAIDIQIKHTEVKDFFLAIEEFNRCIGYSDELKVYLKQGMARVRRLITQEIPTDNELIICGGLSVLPWKDALHKVGYDDVEVLVCDIIKQYGKDALAVTIAPMLNIDLSNCSVFEGKTFGATEGDLVGINKQELALDDEDTGDDISFEDEEEELDEVSEAEDDFEFDLYADEEDEKPQRKSKESKFEAKVSKKSKNHKSTKKVDLEEDFEDEEEEVVEKPSKKQRGSKRSNLEEYEDEEIPTEKPKRQQRSSKKPKQERDLEEEDFEEEEEVKVKPKKKRSSRKPKPKVRQEDYDDEDDDIEVPKKKKSYMALIVILCSIVVIGAACFYTYNLFLAHKANQVTDAQQVESAKSAIPLADYVKGAADAAGIQLVSEKSEVVGTQEFYYAGIDNITESELVEFVDKLPDCNKEFVNNTQNADGTYNVTLKFNFL